jgi:hypothetical protein
LVVCQERCSAGTTSERLFTEERPSARLLLHSKCLDDELLAAPKDELSILNRTGCDLLEVLDAYPPLEDASIRITAIDMHYFSTSFFQELLYL